MQAMRSTLKYKVVALHLAVTANTCSEASEAELNTAAQNKHAALLMASEMLDNLRRGLEYNALDYVHRHMAIRRALDYIPSTQVNSR